MTTHIVEDIVKVLKALGDGNRLNIVLSIDRKALSVSEIIKATGLTQTLVSFHLRALREANIVPTEQSGPFIYYSMSDQALTKKLMTLARSAYAEKTTAKEKIISMPADKLK
jgi:ArsR family transcriptional regulator